MEGTNYSLSDIASVTGGNGFGGNNIVWLLVIFLLIGGMGFNRGDYGNYATAASQQEILYGQHFQNLDNKLDRLGFGISDATYALNNTVIGESRGIQDKLYEAMTAAHAEGEATRALIQQNKIDTLQNQVNELRTSQMLCGVPKINPYLYGVYPYNTGCNRNCGNI